MTTPTPAVVVDQSLLYPSPYKEFWQAFAKNKGAVAGLAFMLLIIFCALFAPWVAPHDPSEQYRDFLLTPPARLEGASGRSSSAPTNLAVTCCRGRFLPHGSRCRSPCRRRSCLCFRALCWGCGPSFSPLPSPPLCLV